MGKTLTTKQRLKLSQTRLLKIIDEDGDTATTLTPPPKTKKVTTTDSNEASLQKQNITEGADDMEVTPLSNTKTPPAPPKQQVPCEPTETTPKPDQPAARLDSSADQPAAKHDSSAAEAEAVAPQISSAEGVRAAPLTPP